MSEYLKTHTEKLTVYEAIQLFDQMKKNGLLQSDPNNENNILIYRGVGDDGSPEGWYTENLISAASELANDYNSQRSLWKALEDVGFEPKFQPAWWKDEEYINDVGRDMQALEWTTSAGDKEADEAALAQFTVFFNEKTDEEIINTLKNCGIDRDLYDSGDLVVFVEQDIETGDMFFTDGGYPVYSPDPDIDGDVYLLTEAGEVIPTGIILSKSEAETVLELARKNISKAVEKEKSDKSKAKAVIEER